MRDVEVVGQARLQAREKLGRSPVLEHVGVHDDVGGEHRGSAGQLPDVHVVDVRDSRRTQNVTANLGDLPERHVVWRLAQDHVNPRLLFAGTEFGLFFTVDGGRRWIELTGGVLPPGLFSGWRDAGLS